MTFRSSGPDAIPPVSTIGDIEQRMGIPPLETLLAERDELVKQVAPLRAKHGPFGSFDALRKIALASVASKVRAQALLNGTKVTEAAIDEAAHASPEYADFVTQGTREKAEWAILENGITSIADTINRGQAIARYLSAEIGLSR